MNEFELYTMMFFWIDNYYADSTDDRINNLIGEMNPFLWQDICSADPAYYDEFCRYMKGKNITLDNSFELAKNFAKTIDYVDVTETFEESDYDKWKNGCKRYIAEEHKGGEELIYVYNGKKYFSQGYLRKDKVYVFELQLWEPEVKTLWQISEDTNTLQTSDFVIL